MSYEKELAFAKTLALEAGGTMHHYFRSEEIGTEWKADNTPVTVADNAINRMVIEQVQSVFPSHGILGEEESYETGRDAVWVVDPIDGTVPFSLAIPVSTFMAALVNKEDGQPVVSVIYDPYLNHLYSAVKGQGAYLNDEPINASPEVNLNRSYATLYGNLIKNDTVDYAPGVVMEQLRGMGAKVINISSGGYTAAKIATGEFALLAMGNGKPWDAAAPALIVQEAGGLAVDFNGEERRYDESGLGTVMAANRAVLDTFFGLIKV
jgi:myo-inositol-1(or 4)-monophosphatase